MKIVEKVNLSKYTSFKIGGVSKYFATINSKQDLNEAFEIIYSKKLNFFTLGGGSNLLINDDGFDGIVLQIANTGFEMDRNSLTIFANAGIKLDEIVRLSVEEYLSGLESLSGIPGTVGGAIRGNAGAYGTEIKDIIESVTYYQNGEMKTITNKECEFAYRESIFKKDKSRIILSAIIKLSEENKNNLLQKRKEIIDTRNTKQPLEYPNAGSFFKNPIVSNEILHEIPLINEMPKWVLDDKSTKLSAAWLIEKAGLKGYKINDAGISEKHSLFIVNYGNAKAKDVILIMKTIQNKIKDMFKVDLTPEVELVGF